jgi:hypothetical protein
MKLECQIESGRYHLFVREGEVRWRVLLPGTSPEEETEGMTRDEVILAGLLAGFALKDVERAIRRVELSRGQSEDGC